MKFAPCCHFNYPLYLQPQAQVLKLVDKPL